VTAMRVADYIAGFIARLGVTHVFMVTGGGAMHLDDALGRRDDLELVFCHHEQACAIGVEGYARVRGDLGVAVVTTGPGGTNTVTGVLGQWHDSVPALYISGQVRYDTTVASTGLPLRQLGDQEADIVRLVAPITKYAASVTDPRSVRYHVEKAVWLARTGRPGPVWLDVPLNVQAATVESTELVRFDPAEMTVAAPAVAAHLGPGWPPVRPAAQAVGALTGVFDHGRMRRQVGELVERLAAAERPVVLAGSGVRTAGALSEFLEVVEVLGVPVCTAWNAHDLMWEEHPLYAGRPSSLGDRAGNFAVQNADLLLVLGCRLNVRQIGYEFAAFAHHAYRVAVDVDEAELAKPTVSLHLPIHADVLAFLTELSDALTRARGGMGADAGAAARARHEWVAWCRERRRRYPVVSPERRTAEASPIDAYVFVDALSELAEADDVVVCANGAACVVTFQAFKVKRGQRLIANSGTAGMGYDLPAAVGAALAAGRRTICLAGDGSIMMNLQELETIAYRRLPVKVFVFNNFGYLSIRQTQDNLCDGRRVGEGPLTGVGLPDFVRLAEAFGIRSARVERQGDLSAAIGEALTGAGPYLLDVAMQPDQVFAPRVMAQRLPDGRLVSKPLEDMYPFLPREEFASNMIVESYEPVAGGRADGRKG
jgi:acetolactate synthase I/II/III large subunit